MNVRFRFLGESVKPSCKALGLSGRKEEVAGVRRMERALQEEFEELPFDLRAQAEKIRGERQAGGNLGRFAVRAGDVLRGDGRCDKA